MTKLGGVHFPTIPAIPVKTGIDPLRSLDRRPLCALHGRIRRAVSMLESGHSFRIGVESLHWSIGTGLGEKLA